MQSLIDFKNSLNAQQYDAVVSTEGPHLVIAGAGSGKTRVLVYRTAYLVDQGIDPRQILLLTFTRRSANEMLERAASILDERCRNVSGGTFHSFANLILRRYADRMDLSPHFTILDDSDATAIIARLRAARGLDKADKKFPRKNTVYDIISKSVNKCTDVADIIYDEMPQFEPWIETIEDIKEQYMVQKRQMGVLDFDDLLISLRNLLQTRSDVRKALSQQYRYIMVDEYQDTNRIQAQIVRLLADVHDNVMAVGDDSQSIYSFRGALFKNIIDFPDVFPGTRLIKLEENYRSSQPILDLTNEVVSCAQEKFEKILFTRQEGSRRPVYRDVMNETAQSEYIVSKIREMQSRGTALDDIAVLFRSGWHSNYLEIELSRWGIPFVKYGGQKFVDSAHVRDIVAYLKILQNPSDQTSWMRVLTLMRGIGPKTAAGIAQAAAEAGSCRACGTISVKQASVRRLLEFVSRIDSRAQSPEEILDLTLQFYYPILVDQYDDYDKRGNDLESLQKVVKDYDLLENFLADITLDPPEQSVLKARERGKAQKSLVLSTIHSAKGLEWDTVFVIHLCEGQLPSYRAFDDQGAIEEERRLFYVATTRAKRHLFLLRPQMLPQRGGQGPSASPYTRVSRFLGEGRILDLLVDIEHRRPSMDERPRSGGWHSGQKRDMLADYFDRTESCLDDW